MPSDLGSPADGRLGRGAALAQAKNHTPHLWALLAGEIWRRAKRPLVSGPVRRWRFSGRTPERVLIAPPDLRPADPLVANEIYSGRFPFAGYMVETGGQSPFQADVANAAWVEALHSFRWLRHMQAAGTDLAAANARALVSDWIATHGKRLAAPAWDPAVTAKRTIAWLQHSAVVLQGAELSFYRSFLRLLAVQIRYLRTMAPQIPDGEERLRALIALAFGALSLPAPPAALRVATRNLAAELDRQIFPDGGHVSRNPAAVLELLADLLPLRQTYQNQAEPAPEALLGAIERMLPALRFFRHRDGALARFNGTGVTAAGEVMAVLRHDDTGGAPLLHAPHSGFERLTMGSTTVIVDTGAAPPPAASRKAHAGCLSFEMSSGQRLFIVNSGVDSHGPDEFRPLARATAAHSTATVNDSSSGRFNLSPRLRGLLGTVLIDGSREVICERNDGHGVQSFTARHDGYLARFGLYHEREMALTGEGGVIDGADRFFGRGGAAPHGGRDRVVLRFHVHPDIAVGFDERNRLILAAAQGEAWSFSCETLQPVVEESIFFAGVGGPRRSRQIAVSFNPAEHHDVRWRIVRTRTASS